MTNSKAKTNPFTALIPRTEPLKTEYDDSLPPCPLCKARALAGYDFAGPTDIAHDCDCILNDHLLYQGAVRRLWAARQSLPHLLAQLPERFHNARAKDFLGSPEAMLLCARPTSGYIYGPAGVGKSHLAAAAALAAARKGVWVAYWPLNRLIQTMRDAAAGECMRPDLLTPGMVVIEDLGKFKATEFTYEVLYNVAEERWANGRPTIYTANHDAMTTARVSVPTTMFPSPAARDEAARALQSRFEAGLTCAVGGTDRRVAELN